jgi:hypothetical protein
MMKAPDGGEIIEKFVNAPLESAQVSFYFQEGVPCIQRVD